MIKNTLFLTISILLFSSCKKDNDTSINNGYTITINAEIADNTKAYLQRFDNQEVQKIDSTSFLNNSLSFKGSVAFPERYLITINDVFGGLVLIVENDSILVTVRNNDLINAHISGSKLNKELKIYKATLNKIYSKVDPLFPEIQRARLNNDAEKLELLINKMEGIEVKSVEFSFNYVSEKLDSYIAAIILNDLSGKDSIDIKQITSLYNKMSEDVKKCPDAIELNDFLNTYK